MRRLTAAICAVGTAILLFGSAIQASALGAGFSATISPDCVAAGQAVTITVPNLQPGSVISVQLRFGTTTLRATGTPNAQGVVTLTLTIPSTAVAGTATISILEASLDEAELGTGSIRIQSGADACPSPGLTSIEGTHLSVVASYGVKKTCDAGVSGNAVFSMSASLGEIGSFAFPSVTLACNGATVLLPGLPIGSSTVTLHETIPATGAVAAADTTFRLPPASIPVTINNARAASAATPAPTPVTPVRLPATGGGSGPQPWLLALLGASAIAAGTGLRRRYHAP